jgi:hypothetical protein
MIPANEADTLMMTVNDAIDLAADGQVADGYAALVWGLHRANPAAHYSPPQTPLARHPSTALQ